MKKIPIIAIVAIITLFSCGPGSSQASEIIGIWQTAITGGTETLQFNQDGTAVDSSDTFATQSGAWTVSGNTLTLAYPSTSAINAVISFPNYSTMIETPSAGTAITWTRIQHL
jgi:hypothetical protein